MLNMRTILEKAERLIREEGWYPRLGTGMLERVFQAAGQRFGHTIAADVPELQAVLEHLREHLNVRHLSRWEHEPGRTIDDVLAALAGAKDKLVA